MRKFLLERSPTGVEHSIHVSDDELLTVEHTPSAVEQEVVEHVRVSGDVPPPPRSNLRYAGSIPIALYQAWRKEWQAAPYETWQKFLVRKLNSPEYKYLRAGGRKL